MYYETTEVEKGLYLVLVYNHNNKFLFDRYICADSFSEAEGKITELIKEVVKGKELC